MRSDNKGFSLIVAAALIIMLGALLVRALPSPDQAYKTEYTTTLKRMSEIRERLQVYKDSKYLNNSKYPCPARRDIAVTNAAFGVEVANCTSNLTVTGTVSIGAVPVKALQLPNEYAFDGWGNYFTYLKDQNDAATISSTNIAGTSNPLPSREFVNSDMSSLALAIVSHGPDGQGAYNRNGIMATACNNTEADYENCDNDAVLIYDSWNAGGSYDDMVMGLSSSKN